MIDLDAPPPVRPRPRSGDRRRWRAAAATALLLVLGGATVPSPVAGPIEQVASSGGAVVASLLTESVVYTALPVAGENAVELWARPLAGPGTSWSARIPGETIRLRRAEGVVVAEFAGTVTVFDAEDGTVRWRDRVGVLAVGDRQMLVAGAEGLLEIRDVRDGRLSATLGDGDFPVLGASIVGARLYLFGELRLQALRLPDLSPVWQTRSPYPESARACGRLLCVTDPRGLVTFDPATGRGIWRIAYWNDYRGDTAPVGGRSRGVVTSDRGQAAVIDTATGRTVGELGRDIPVGDLRLRPDGDRVWIRRLESGAVLGSLTGIVPSGCAAAGPFLGCPAADRVFTVWRVRA